MSNLSQIFQCCCGFEVNQKDLEPHLKQCLPYNQNSPFYNAFKTLRIQEFQTIHLMVMSTELGIYQKAVQTELDKRLGKPSQQIKIFNSSDQNKKEFILEDDDDQLNTIKFLKSSSKNNPGFVDPSMYNDEIIECLACKKKFYAKFDTDKIWYLMSCLHTFCRACLNKQINSDYINNNGSVSCVQCKSAFEDEDIKQLLGEKKKEEIDQKLMMKQFNITKCMKCKEQFAFETGKLSNNVKNEKGQLISKQHEIHYVNNRFMCPSQNCRTEQCKSCGVTPYHMGYTCEEYGQKQSSSRCRYCDETIIHVNRNDLQAYQDICSAEECVKKKQNACDKVLPCGHGCRGVKGEINCQPCLHEDCFEANEGILMGQSGADYCNICFVESLSSAPCIRAQCGHIFHFHCIKKKLEVKWISARINFNFCLCPLCKQWMQFPIESSFTTQMIQHQTMFEDLKKKSLERLKFEERMKDEKLINPSSNFYNKAVEYGIAIYAYYMCFKCQKPYFGGHKDCQQNMDDGNKEFNPKELICANCCDIPVDNCPKHGKDFIEFKCKFCCSIAQWFCWGTTHFCEPCHKRQCAGDYVSKYPIDKLPKCGGKDKCPLKCDHQPNGNECSLGCSVCRNIKENARDF